MDRSKNVHGTFARIADDGEIADQDDGEITNPDDHPGVVFPQGMTARGRHQFLLKSNSLTKHGKPKLADTRVRLPNAVAKLLPQPWRAIRLPDVVMTCQGTDWVVLWVFMHYPVEFPRCKAIKHLNFELSCYELWYPALFEALKLIKDVSTLEQAIRDVFCYNQDIYSLIASLSPPQPQPQHTGTTDSTIQPVHSFPQPAMQHPSQYPQYSQYQYPQYAQYPQYVQYPHTEYPIAQMGQEYYAPWQYQYQYPDDQQQYGQQQQQQQHVEQEQHGVPDENDELAAMTLHTLSGAQDKPKSKTVSKSKTSEKTSEKTRWVVERPGRPPVYDAQVRWCISMKRLVAQRFNIPGLTLEEVIYMANSFFANEKRLVGSTLRKRVVALFEGVTWKAGAEDPQMTWSDIAGPYDKEKNLPITDESLIVAMHTLMPQASSRLREVYLKSFPVEQQIQEQIQEDEEQQQQQQEIQEEQQQQQQQPSCNHECDSRSVRVLSYADVQTMAAAVDLGDEIGMFNFIDSLSKVSFPGLSGEEVTDFISAWMLDKFTSLQKRLIITTIRNNIVDDPLKVVKTIKNFLNHLAV